MFKTLLQFFSVMQFTICLGQTPVEKGLNCITPEALKAQLGFLASDWTEGRMAGEKGAYLSSDYIASMLQLYGVSPYGDYSGLVKKGRSFFQNFVLLKATEGDEQHLVVKSAEYSMVKQISFSNNIDFTINTADQTIEIEAPVVFATYGLINKNHNYNDLNSLDVKGKFILRVTGFPKFIRETASAADLDSYVKEMESVYKAMGAAGIIEVYPDADVVGIPEKKDFMNMSPSEWIQHPEGYNSSFSLPSARNDDNLTRIKVSQKTAIELLKGSGINIEDYIKKADINEPYQIQSIKNKSVYIKSTVRVTRVPVRNVIGIIEGNDTEQIIVLGAHYDHMGMNNGYIWNGADDNGSGTVGIMTLAKAIMASGKKPEKTIIIALWAAEEEGLMGSRYWISNPIFPLKNIRLNLNFDMISRYISSNTPKNVIMTYSDIYPDFKNMTKSNLKKYDIDLIVDYQPSPDPPGGSDHRSFVAAGIPVMRFKAGHREEYHTPNDELQTINWDIMEKITRISFVNIWELANTNW